MAVRAPEPVREAWGDEAVIAFIPWLDEILADKTVPRDEYRQVLSRLDLLEHGVALQTHSLTWQPINLFSDPLVDP